MKKLSYFLLSLVVLLSACSKDNIVAPEQLGENTYRLTVAPETTVKTRSAAPDKDGLTTRYILEIYNNDQLYQRVVQTSTTFDFRLMTSQTYDFLVWVDYTSNGVDDYHYNTEKGLKAITLKKGDAYKNNDHGRDAFFGVLKAQAIQTTSKDFGSLVCKRPFAQLNIKTLDWTETNSIKNNPALKPTKISASFTAPDVFDVYSGTVSGSQEYTYTYKLGITDQTRNDQALTCDYIFASTEGDFVSPAISFINKDGDEVTNTGTYLNTLPIKRNYQTNVSGSLISKKNKVEITVDAEWAEPSTELTRPEGETSSLYIKKDDARYNPATGVYTIDPSKIGSQDTKLVLIFQGDFPNNITIVIPDNMPAGIQDIVIDANMTNGSPSITISNETFSGMVSLKHELPALNENTSIQDLNIHLPNGSFTLGAGVVVEGNMSVWTKGATFLMEEGTVVKGNMTVKGGRSILKGEVKGIIYAYGDSKVDIVKNGVTKKYYTSSITENKVSAWYGFGVGVDDLLDDVMGGFTLPEFLDLSFIMNYAAAYASFDFGNHANGLDWRDMRNVQYTIIGADNSKSVAKLKKDFAVGYSTPKDLQDAINKPILDVKAALDVKVAQINALMVKVNGKLPEPINSKLVAEVNKLKNSVAYYQNTLPTVSFPAGVPQLPFATILPAADNFDFTTISRLIGTPNDKVNLLDIPAYINGTKPLTLYMVINLLTDYKNSESDLDALKAEKAALEQQKADLNAEKAQLNSQVAQIKTLPAYVALTNQLNTLVSEYDALPNPVSRTIGYPSYTFVAAQKNTLFETLGGTYFGGEVAGVSLVQKWTVVAIGTANATEVAKMNAKNAKIDAIEAKVVQMNAYITEQSGALGTRINAIDAQISTIDAKINGTLGQLFTDGLNARILATETQTSVIQGALTQMGIDQGTIDTIVNVLVAVEPYLSTVADVANSINDVMVQVQTANPWEYSTKAIKSTTPLNSRMEIEAKFEYESGKLLYLYSK